MPLAAGTINSNFRVRAGAGQTWFLRVNEGKSELDVSYEAALVEHVAGRGVATPPPLRTRAGEPFARLGTHLVTIFPWVEGAHLAPRDVRASHVKAVGAALARLHQAGTDFPDHRAGIYTLERMVERFASIEHSTDPMLGEALPLLRQELMTLPGARAAHLPEGVIHQDLFRDNVLFDAHGAITALIDFEQAVRGRLAYDLAVCLLAWCFEGEAFHPALVAALLGGYSAVRPLVEPERRGLPVEARVAAVRFTITRITDVYLRPAGAPAAKDFRSYLARVRALARGELDDLL